MVTQPTHKERFACSFSCRGRKPTIRLQGQLKTRILSRYPDPRICCVVASKQPWCTVRDPSHWRLVQLLYFGSSGKDWSAHIRRDLGHIRYEPVELSKSRFPDRGSLLSYLEERELQHRIHRLDEYPQLLPALITAVEKTPTAN